MNQLIIAVIHRQLHRSRCQLRLLVLHHSKQHTQLLVVAVRSITTIRLRPFLLHRSSLLRHRRHTLPWRLEELVVVGVGVMLVDAVVAVAVVVGVVECAGRCTCPFASGKPLNLKV